MCIGIPMQVQEIEAFRAKCQDRDGGFVWVDTRLIENVLPGDWILTFAGAARDIMTPDDAARTLDALGALESLLNGGQPDLNACFADLIDREPQLPDFLRPEKS